jgi:magnesium transporter
MPSSKRSEGAVAAAWGLPSAVGRGIGGLGRVVASAFQFLPGAHPHADPLRRRNVGAPPGIESASNVDTPPEPGKVLIRVIDYSPDRMEAFETDNVDELITRPRPDWASARWVNVDGLHPFVVNRLRQHYAFHTLAAEDVVHVPQRPKFEAHNSHIFVVVRMLALRERELSAEQISLFLFKDVVLTFQERNGDVWDPVRARLKQSDSRTRQRGTSYLLYALLDSLVDHCFPLLEHYGDHLEDLELDLVERAAPATLQALHAAKRELALIRRVLWPMRDAIGALYREESQLIPSEVQTYLRDVHDHTVQAIDVIETYRELAAGLTDLYMSAVSNRMNEIMKVLTIMASLFIPVTFLAGVYGMNFEHIPELKWQYSYPLFWFICVTTIVTLLTYFYRKGWIGR